MYQEYYLFFLIEIFKIFLCLGYHCRLPIIGLFMIFSNIIRGKEVILIRIFLLILFFASSYNLCNIDYRFINTVIIKSLRLSN